MFPSRYSYFIFIYCCLIHLLVVCLFIHICGSISSSKLTFKTSLELEEIAEEENVNEKLTFPEDN